MPKRRTQRKTIVYLYNQLKDPLIQSNIYLYIKNLGSYPLSLHHFAIVTFETRETLNDIEKVNEMKDHLRHLNVSWYPCQWHPGTSLLIKFMDLMSGFYRVTLLRFAGYRHIISLGSIAGSFAYLFSVVLRFRLYLYQYEPHSEYEVDSGTYSQQSITFKILNFLEKQSAFFASVISSGTCHMENRLKKWSVKAKFFTIPSVVNEDKFIFSEVDRNFIREKYCIGNEKVVLYYPGKFGGMYYKEETIKMFAILLEKDQNFHALIVTPNNVDEIISLFLRLKVARERFTVSTTTYDNIHMYNSAADFAVIAARPGPSKKFTSNIKVGEYLCSGLPYLISRGISEDDEYAIRYQVGVVVKNFSNEEIASSYERIMDILAVPTIERRNHCREIGIDYRGFSKLRQEFRRAVQTLHSM